MGEEKLLTVRDVSILLGLSESQVLELAEDCSIPAYKVGGVYLRFKRDQIEEFRKKTRGTLAHPRKYSFFEKTSDFFYYNDFYILSTLIIILMIYIIFR
jgi:excisionase family DNA binding protein